MHAASGEASRPPTVGRAGARRPAARAASATVAAGRSGISSCAAGSSSLKRARRRRVPRTSCARGARSSVSGVEEHELLLEPDGERRRCVEGARRLVGRGQGARSSFARRSVQDSRAAHEVTPSWGLRARSATPGCSPTRCGATLTSRTRCSTCAPAAECWPCPPRCAARRRHRRRRLTRSVLAARRVNARLNGVRVRAVRGTCSAPSPMSAST